MKKILFIFLLLSLPVLSQTVFQPHQDIFTFDQSSAITSWDNSDPANPPYPYAMGAILLERTCSYNTCNGPGIEVPFQLGYLNNGYLVPCDTIVFSPVVWLTGNGTHDGDTFQKSGTANCPYFTGEYGGADVGSNSDKTHDGFSVVAQYVHHIVTTTCQRYHRPPCYKIYDTLGGGSGTITQTVTN